MENTETYKVTYRLPTPKQSLLTFGVSSPAFYEQCVCVRAWELYNLYNFLSCFFLSIFNSSSTRLLCNDLLFYWGF